jgi:hypothetical protein
MIEILALLILGGQIADMARRRGRSPTLFVLMLCLLWFGGEVAGGVLGYLLFGAGGTRTNSSLHIVYSMALAGAAAGGLCAFVLARAIGPVGGMFREVQLVPVRRSRLLGVIVGGLGGGLIGGVVPYVMYGGQEELSVVLQGALAVSAIGALLGLVSGVQREQTDPEIAKEAPHD